MKHICTSALAGLALFSSQAAYAQQACVQPADLDDTILYAMPALYEAVMESCADQYRADGFMKSEGEAFVEQFRAKQDDAWPGALRLLQGFADRGSDGDDAMMDMVAALPPETLRPFVDSLVVQMVSDEIKPDSCETIERGVELLSPLPPENVSALVTFIAEQAKLDNPPICGAEPATIEGAAE